MNNVTTDYLTSPQPSPKEREKETLTIEANYVSLSLGSCPPSFKRGLGRFLDYNTNLPVRFAHFPLFQKGEVEVGALQ